MTNKFLVFLLISLFSFAYYLEEYRPKQLSENEKFQRQLFSLDKLGWPTEISGINFHIKKEKDHWITMDRKLMVSISRLQWFFQELSNLDFLNVIDFDENLQKDIYLGREKESLAFLFGKKRVTFTLGRKQEFSRKFYMSFDDGSGEKVLLVKDRRPLDRGVPKHEYETTDQQFKNIVTLFSLKNSFFEEKRIFLNEEKSSYIRFSGKRNKEFTLNLSGESTKPQKFTEIEYRREKLLEIKESLRNLTAEIIFSEIDKTKLLHPVSLLETEKSTYKLYRQYNNQEGYFVLDGRRNLLFKIRQIDSKIFFLNLKYFWDKSVLKLKEKERFEFVWSNDKKTELNIVNNEIFKVAYADQFYLPKNKKFFELFKILQSQAVDIKRGKCLKGDKKPILTIKQIGGLTLSVHLDEFDVSFCRSDGLIFTFFFTDSQPLPLSFNEYFTEIHDDS